MSNELVITAVGPDRKGLVGEITAHIHKAGCNLADSRMVNLRGRFAIVALIEGAGDALEKARAALVGASDSMGVHFDFSTGLVDKPQGGVPYRLKTYSMDQPGIVHRFTALLKEHGVNIEELETRLESAPFMGTPVFTMEIHMSVPPKTSVKALKRALEDLGDAMNADVDVES
jgi:glycine cleavage system transcriptional repressor